MRNLDLFREVITAARRQTGRLQRELADSLGIAPQVLSRKLHGARQAFLTHAEVKQIIKTLASWEAIATREQAVEILDLMDCPHFSAADWETKPLSYLRSASTKIVQSQSVSGSHEQLLPRMPFHVQLSYERERRGWSQADIASRVGCDGKTIARWERGETLPRPYYRQALSELFEKTAEELGLAKKDTIKKQYPTSPISIFISSKMQELTEERRAVQGALKGLCCKKSARMDWA